MRNLLKGLIMKCLLRIGYIVIISELQGYTNTKSYQFTNDVFIFSGANQRILY